MNEEIFNNIANIYDDIRWYGLGAIHDAMYSEDRGCSVLDVGCGNGRVLSVLWNMGFRNLYGIDISEKMISVASSKLPYVNFFHADFRHLFDMGKVFDVILFIHSLHLITPVNKTIKIARKVGKKFVIVSNTFKNLKNTTLIKYFPECLQYDEKRFAPVDALRRSKSISIEFESIYNFKIFISKAKLEQLFKMRYASIMQSMSDKQIENACLSIPVEGDMFSGEEFCLKYVYKG